MMEVKIKRRYDASRRRARAAETQGRILDIALQHFLGKGYAQTTVADVAAGADASVETVYKSFGGKSGLVRALWERGLDGRGVVPAPQRSDEMSTTEADPVQVIRGWGKLTTELAPEIAPIMLLVRGAAATDPEMATLLAEADAQRRTRMRQNARLLQKRDWLRPGISLEAATDILWTYSSPELYELLVLKSEWPVHTYGQFIGEALIAALLPHKGSTEHPR